MRTYVSYENRRGKEYGAGVPDGGYTHLRGWDAGVKIVAVAPKNGVDSFEIYMTGGSHAAHKNVRLGTVTDTPSGPVFEPAPSVLDQDGAKLS